MGKVMLNGREYISSTGLLPECYSTEERTIGTWTDGKPLYEKTVTFGNIPAGTNNYTIQMGLSNVDNVIEYNGMCYDSANNNYFRLPLTIIHLPYSDLQKYSATIQTYNKSADTVRIDTGTERPIAGGYITIRYTKTTDTPGSGTYTPNGTLSHHYSTTEHIVGTWTDGKPLYEKTIVDTMPTVITDGTFVDKNIDVTALDIDKAIKIDMMIDQGNAQVPLFYANNSNRHSKVFYNNEFGTIYLTSNNTVHSAKPIWITIQYTKTTD